MADFDSGYYDRTFIAKTNKRIDYLEPGGTKIFSLNIKLAEQKEII
jgi:hypothetical protein